MGRSGYQNTHTRIHVHTHFCVFLSYLFRVNLSISIGIDQIVSKALFLLCSSDYPISNILLLNQELVPSVPLL